MGPDPRSGPSSEPGLEDEERELIRSLEKETVRAFRFFRTLEPGPVVAMFGSSRLPSSDPVCRFARTFGEAMGREGIRVLAGGHDGAMGAALSGAGRWGTALEWDPASGDPYETDRRLVFRHLFLRKHFFLRKIRAVVLFPGGFGTMDELFELLALRQVNDWAGIPAFCAESPERPFWMPFWDGLSAILKSAPYLPADAECPLPVESDPVRLGARVLSAVRTVGD